MSDPFVRIYLTEFAPLSLVSRLREIDLTLEIPSSPGRVAMLDPEGNQIPTAIKRFEKVAGLSGVESATFQMWFSASEDLVLSWSRRREFTGDIATICVVAYLDGLTSGQAQAVADLFENVAVGAPSRLVALIVDFSGRSADFNWLDGIKDPIQAPRVDKFTVSRRLVGGDASEPWLPLPPAAQLATRIWPEDK